MTTDHIAFDAAERPNAVAFVIKGRDISFAEFARDIRKFAGTLREFELPRGAKVAINVDDGDGRDARDGKAIVFG